MALRSPTVYTQRLVERLNFLPHGGQRWQRDLQILIPKVAGLADEDHWFIVSLGIFARRRFPDFSVVDCSGRALNLVTRAQHGHCLTELTISQHLTDRERSRISRAARRRPHGEIAQRYAALYEPTFRMFTSVETEVLPAVRTDLMALLSALGSASPLPEARADLFFEDLTELSQVTQYLCWVRGRPGWAVRLTASYTMPDPAKLAGGAQTKLAVPDPADGGDRTSEGWGNRLRATIRSRCSRFYAGIGLGPLPYYLSTPANDHAASYYFTMEPPPETGVAYLDWGLANSIDGDDECRCAHPSFHIHNGTSLSVAGQAPTKRRRIPGARIYAFLRLDPADHKQVVFAALLNLMLVWLAEAGRLAPQANGLPSPWLAFIPAALLAYVAQQRRHYLATATRRIRGILWTYLALNILFLLSITFDIADDGSFADRHGASDDVVSLVMAAASIGVFYIFAFRGRLLYGRLVHSGVKLLRLRNNCEPLAPEVPEREVHSYVRVSRWYGHVVVAAAVATISLMGALFLTGNLWPEGEGEGREQSKKSQVERRSAGSRTDGA